MVAIAISWRSRGDQAVRADAHPIIVVLGANGGLISKEIQPALKPPADSTVPLAFSDGLQNEDIHLVFNEEWSEGIASSIRSGIMALREADPSADGVILAVCDQPHITADLLNELITTQVKTGLPIVASAYEGATGTPVLFHRSMFPELMTLKGDIGAKKLIHQYADSVATVPFPGGGMDIDTDADYKALLD
jgi:molybdenum cofactor cytidylyltransferase